MRRVRARLLNWWAESAIRNWRDWLAWFIEDLQNRDRDIADTAEWDLVTATRPARSLTPRGVNRQIGRQQRKKK